LRARKRQSSRRPVLQHHHQLPRRSAPGSRSAPWLVSRSSSSSPAARSRNKLLRRPPSRRRPPHPQPRPPRRPPRQPSRRAAPSPSRVACSTRTFRGRLDHAITAAITAIERLRDGDRVSVVAFDHEAQTVVPPTTLDASSRATIAASIKKITLGGDTCISCGITRALDDLGTGSGRPRRILLLSDGEATAGIKDVAGLEKLAHDAEARDVSITTVGVGQDYDPRALTAIARASNGRHHYAGSEAAMPAIFDEEAKAMSAVVATDAEATIHLQPGVEVVSVLDRKHTVSGSTVRVPLGQFTSGERKTVLLEIAVSPTMMGPLAVADVDVAYRDQATSADAHAKGKLSLLVATGDMETDPVVEARVHRSETASALLEANKLFAEGKTKEAQTVLTKQANNIAAKKKVISAKPAPTAVAADLEAQKKALESAGDSYGAAAAAAPAKPAAAPAAKDEIRKSAKKAYDMGY
jgi:Ca-activated chloride channel family protein